MYDHALKLFRENFQLPAHRAQKAGALSYRQARLPAAHARALGIRVCTGRPRKT